MGDKYGRKLVLLCGSAGLSIATICFGFSKTLTSLFLSRALQGVLNANVGTIKTMFGEMTRGDEVAMARVFSFIPIVWASGATFGYVDQRKWFYARHLVLTDGMDHRPLIGGFLEHPARHFPEFSGQLWRNYPYLLPCIATASISMIGFITVICFVQEVGFAETSFIFVLD